MSNPQPLAIKARGLSVFEEGALEQGDTDMYSFHKTIAGTSRMKTRIEVPEDFEFKGKIGFEAITGTVTKITHRQDVRTSTSVTKSSKGHVTDVDVQTHSEDLYEIFLKHADGVERFTVIEEEPEFEVGTTVSLLNLHHKNGKNLKDGGICPLTYHDHYTKNWYFNIVNVKHRYLTWNTKSITVSNALGWGDFYKIMFFLAVAICAVCSLIMGGKALMFWVVPGIFFMLWQVYKGIGTRVCSQFDELITGPIRNEFLRIYAANTTDEEKPSQAIVESN